MVPKETSTMPSLSQITEPSINKATSTQDIQATVPSLSHITEPSIKKATSTQEI